ncbi:MAG: nitroreductase [Marinomonas sp.]
MTNRRAVRAFLPDPLSKAEVKELLSQAANAPSNSNTQPWNVHVLTGAAKQGLTQAIYAQAAQTPMGDDPDVPIYPQGMGEPWRTRRFDCGERMYEALGIGREDKAARMAQAGRNLSFFDAPVGLIITMDRSLAELQILDCGIFLQTLMLLAQERGLATCPQAAWSMWAGTIRRTLNLPENEMVLVGMALGYADQDEVAANIPMGRLGSDGFASFHGFE